MGCLLKQEHRRRVGLARGEREFAPRRAELAVLLSHVTGSWEVSGSGTDLSGICREVLDKAMGTHGVAGVGDAGCT